jgi:hypothetical protein
MRVINWPHVLHFHPTDILPGITVCALMTTPFEILIGDALRTLFSPLTTTSEAAAAQSVVETRGRVSPYPVWSVELQEHLESRGRVVHYRPLESR